MAAEELVHERQPSKKRAHERNKVTIVDIATGEAMRNLRTAAGLSQRDVAERMILPDGTPHPIVAHVLQRLATEGESRVLDSQARKAVQLASSSVSKVAALLVRVPSGRRTWTMTCQRSPRLRTVATSELGPLGGRGHGLAGVAEQVARVLTPRLTP